MHRKLDIKKAAPQAALQYSITTAPGFPVAHEGYRLVLLPLSPDTIHRPPLHGPENCHDPILQYKYYTRKCLYSQSYRGISYILSKEYSVRLEIILHIFL